MNLSVLAIIRFFYFFNLIWMVRILNSVFPLNPPPRTVEILAWFTPDNFHLLAPLIALTTMISLALCIFYPWSRILRCLAFFSILFVVGWLSSRGRVSHAYHGSIYVAFAMIFLPSIKYELNDARTTQALEKYFGFLQLSLVLIYFPAGVWKVREFYTTFVNEGGVEIIQALNNSIAVELLYTGFPMNSFIKLFMEYPYISFLSYVFVMALQLSAPVFVFLPRWNWLFAIFIVIFYWGSIVFLNIPFHAQTILVVLFFFFSPFNRCEPLLRVQNKVIDLFRLVKSQFIPQ